MIPELLTTITYVGFGVAAVLSAATVIEYYVKRHRPRGYRR